MIQTAKTYLTKDFVVRVVLTFVQAFVATALLLEEPLTVDIAVGLVAAAASVTYHKTIAPVVAKILKKYRKD